MSDWGPWCWLCGHPAGYHGTTFCMVRAGAEVKKQCDCKGYCPPPGVPAQPTPVKEGE